jgi:hypothetical protein
MPSKKKARSQARKAKKEEANQQAAASSSDGSNGSAAPGDSTCNHIKLPEGRTVEDFKEAWALFQYFTTQFEAYHTMLGVAFDIGGEVGR